MNHPAQIPSRTGERLRLEVTTGDADDAAHTEVSLWHYRVPPSGGADSDPTDTIRAAHSVAGQEPAPKVPAPRPRLLLIHGFRGDHHGMQVLVDALGDYEVFVPDLPGFGDTPPLRSVNRSERTGPADSAAVEHTVWRYAQIVEACAEALGLGAEDVLVGHSFGSIVAAAHVTSSTRRWKALVLAAPIAQSVFAGSLLPGGAAVEAYYRLAQWLPEPLALRTLRSRWALAVTNLSMGVAWDHQLGSYIRDQHQKYFGSFSDRDTLLQAYRASSRFTAAQFAPALKLPVLLLAGARDQLTTPAGRCRMRDSLPHGNLAILRDTGHLLHYEKPAEAARAIRRFLCELSR